MGYIELIMLLARRHWAGSSQRMDFSGLSGTTTWWRVLVVTEECSVSRWVHSWFPHGL